MLSKNVYLLYPAGYAGNFVSWAINASDNDLSKNTVSSPVYTGQDPKYGANGTSHLHHRTPTHQSIWQHLPWMILNNPQNPQTYVINCCNNNIAFTISSILMYDPDPVFIVIHDNDDPDIRSYGQINCITKWPVYFSAYYAHQGEDLTFDPFNYATDKNFRNLIATNQSGLQELSPVAGNNLEKIKKEYMQNMAWYHTRNSVNPHEVNQDQYLIKSEFPNHCIFQFNCADIVDNKFISILEKILQDSACSSGFDVSRIQHGHEQYIKAQKNLEWFESIDLWKQTGQLSSYLTSHAGIEGQVVFNILKDCWAIDKNIKFRQDSGQQHLTWQIFYKNVKDSSWPDCEREQDFDLLPDHVQNELVSNFKYVPLASRDRARAECRRALLDWKNMTLEQINKIYQSYKPDFKIFSNVS